MSPGKSQAGVELAFEGAPWEVDGYWRAPPPPTSAPLLPERVRSGVRICRTSRAPPPARRKGIPAPAQPPAQRALRWPLSARARIPRPRHPPPQASFPSSRQSQKAEAQCCFITEKRPEEEDEVDCVLLSASKILNSSEGSKGKMVAVEQVKKKKKKNGCSPAVMLLPFYCSKTTINDAKQPVRRLNPLAQLMHFHAPFVGTNSN